MVVVWLLREGTLEPHGRKGRRDSHIILCDSRTAREQQNTSSSSSTGAAASATSPSTTATSSASPAGTAAAVPVDPAAAIKNGPIGDVLARSCFTVLSLDQQLQPFALHLSNPLLVDWSCFSDLDSSSDNGDSSSSGAGGSGSLNSSKRAKPMLVVIVTAVCSRRGSEANYACQWLVPFEGEHSVWSHEVAYMPEHIEQVARTSARAPNCLLKLPSTLGVYDNEVSLVPLSDHQFLFAYIHKTKVHAVIWDLRSVAAATAENPNLDVNHVDDDDDDDGNNDNHTGTNTNTDHASDEKPPIYRFVTLLDVTDTVPPPSTTHNKAAAATGRLISSLTWNTPLLSAHTKTAVCIWLPHHWPLDITSEAQLILADPLPPWAACDVVLELPRIEIAPTAGTAAFVKPVEGISVHRCVSAALCARGMLHIWRYRDLEKLSKPGSSRRFEPSTSVTTWLSNGRVQLSPDGVQVWIATGHEMHVFSTADGALLTSISLLSNINWYLVNTLSAWVCTERATWWLDFWPRRYRRGREGHAKGTNTDDTNWSVFTWW